MEPLLAGQTWSRYRVEAYLGGGGMSDVYLVRHTDLGVTRALKVLKQAGEEVTARLLREGQVQATLMHPNLVPVLELIRIDGHAALVMDYVEGPALDELMERGPLTLEQVDYLARGMLDGMIAAHRRGVIHRDLKPSNVMVDVRDDPPVVRVMDFGLAKAVHGEAGASSTASGVVMGTPRYMAPEQIADAKNVDERADVWSMGALLYELVTGTVAFPGDSLMETLRVVDRAEFVPVTEVRPDLPARMAVAIEEALVREAEDRCPSMQALRDLWVGQDRHIEPPVFDLDGIGRGPTLLPDDDSVTADDAQEPGAQVAGAPGVASTLRPSPAATLDPETAAVLQQAQRRMTFVGFGVAGVGLLAVVAIGVAAWLVVSGGRPDEPNPAPTVAEASSQEVEPDALGAPTPMGLDGGAPVESVPVAERTPEPPPETIAEPTVATPRPSQPKTAGTTSGRSKPQAVVTPAATVTTATTPKTPVGVAAPVQMGSWKPVWVGEPNAQVMLKGPKGEFHLAVGTAPYAVPAGTYEIYVQKGGQPVRTGEIEVKQGKTAAFKCHSGTGICG